jgi:hypothetical protein
MKTNIDSNRFVSKLELIPIEIYWMFEFENSFNLDDVFMNFKNIIIMIFYWIVKRSCVIFEDYFIQLWRRNIYFFT